MDKPTKPKGLAQIVGAGQVEVMIPKDGKTIWIIVDGICQLRVGRIETLRLQDDRRHDVAHTSKKTQPRKGRTNLQATR